MQQDLEGTLLHNTWGIVILAEYIRNPIPLLLFPRFPVTTHISVTVFILIFPEPPRLPSSFLYLPCLCHKITSIHFNFLTMYKIHFRASNWSWILYHGYKAGTNFEKRRKKRKTGKQSVEHNNIWEVFWNVKDVWTCISERLPKRTRNVKNLLKKQIKSFWEEP